MPRNIQLSDEVYARLAEFQGKRETFSKAVARLLDLLEKVGELRTILEGQIELQREKNERLAKLTTRIDAVGIKADGKDPVPGKATVETH